MRTNRSTATRPKKLPFRRQPTIKPVASRDTGESNADLRQVIAGLEQAIAEHEQTNAFLRDLLTEKWFDVPAEEFAGLG